MRDVYMHLPRLGWSHGGCYLLLVSPSLPRSTPGLTSRPRHTLALVLGDWQYTMWDATKVLCQAKTFDMDKHLNLVSTFKILIILNKR